jgi:hypothetical protein
MKGIGDASANGMRRRENEDGGLRFANPPYGLIVSPPADPMP